MATSTPGVLVDVGVPAFERCDVGLDSVLFCRGMAVASFRKGDAVGRAISIATLLRIGVGLKTDTIAELCDASHGGVCDVRRRLAEGGVDRVVEGVRVGAPRKVVGASEQLLRERHAAGASVREIAAALGISKSLAATEVKRLTAPRVGEQQTLPRSDPCAVRETAGSTSEREAEPALAPETPVSSSEPGPANEAVDDVASAVEDLEVTERAAPVVMELGAGVPLESGPAEHPCRYAGTLLICAAASALGVFAALDVGHVTRPVTAVYDAHQVTTALMAAWGAGYSSLEAMHERDARGLGVVLGLQRSPSVRTLHRAIVQMRERIDIVDLNAALIRGVLAAQLPERFWFGLDGHFKAYSGDEPIDKGWDSKRRLASKGVADIFVTDAHGFTWAMHPVAVGSSLSQHLEKIAHTLRSVLGDRRPIVLTFDRGGFDFDVLDALDKAGFFYVGYVPGSVKLPDLAAIAPAKDGVGEVAFDHARLHHRARLLAERDKTALIPVVTNLPTLVDTDTVVRELRAHRGAQENSFKAARSFAHIDHLVDRGGASRAPDDRPIPNPARSALKQEEQGASARVADLAKETPKVSGRSRKDINDDRFWAGVRSLEIKRELRAAPATVPRVTVEPEAQRATLRTRNRLLLQPLKLVTDNARRWLLGALGTALAPSDNPYDMTATARSLLALIRAPGNVRFDDDAVTVTLELPLPPTPHARLGSALAALDSHALKLADGRRVRFRLAPRPTRADVPGRDQAA